ncbi:efflux RND transporter permease subunit [Erythrobacter sp. HKB08]|uniref:efflux RND transporter permease subunit n=1 Tax=Erythrobacter sp. HKB08 TaxID=2502843 RepID=UPI00210173F5|nr:efflux RND transporter permease subunit [Erythrobacter sp. HKB08]
MWLADVSIRRPVFATMLIASLVVLGLVSFNRLGVDLFPEVEFPYVSVTTALSGASPGTMETEVTDVIEEQLNTIAGLRQMRSISAEGVSIVNLEFELEEDADLKAQEVRDKMSRLAADLPDDSEPPVIEKVDPDAAPILSVLLSGDMPIRNLTTFADEEVKERLQRVPGVGSVELVGGREREMRIWLDAAAMRARGVTADDVLGAIQRENAELPGGRLVTEGRTRQFGIRTLAEARTAAEFAAIPILYRPNGQTVRIGDVGRVEDSIEDEESYAQLDGEPGVVLEVRKQSGENTVAVAEQIRAEIESIRTTAPEGVNFIIARDTSRFIEQAIGDVLFDLFIAVVLVVAVTFLFLLSWRATVIVLLAIPTSIVATFVAFAAFDFTVNMVTLLALTVAIGLLVDDAIVVVEAVQNDVDEGGDATEAAHTATRRVALAVLAGTFATLAVFVPIAFMEGIVGRFFFQYGLAIVFSVSVSMLVAFTLTPALSARLLRPEHAESGWLGRVERFHIGMRQRYERLVSWAINRRYLVLGGALASVLIGGFFAALVPSTFMSTTDRSEFLATVKLPQGTGVSEAKKAAEQVDASLRQNPEVELVFVSAGSGINPKINELDVYIGLTPKRSREATQDDVMTFARNEILGDVPAAREVSVEEVPWVSGAGVGQTAIELIITGPDITAINEYARWLEGELAARSEFVDVRSSYEGGRPELQIVLDRDRAADLGISARSLAAASRTLVGGSDAGTFEADGRRYDIRVRLEESGRQGLGDVEVLPLRTGQGTLVDLAAIADVDVALSAAEIERIDRSRQISVLANTAPGVALSVAVADVEELLTANPPPAGLATRMEGTARRLAETSEAIIFAFALAIVALYIVLASQFNSFGQPIIIMLTAPLSFSGAYFLMWAAGQEMSLFAQIGMIALMGIVMKNGILLVDLANRYCEAGKDAASAMRDAAPERLRPVLMTALAAVFGMLPVALAQSDAAEWRNAMGFIIIGGLTTSTFLTLLVVPAAYAAASDLRSVVTNFRPPFVQRPS